MIERLSFSMVIVYGVNNDSEHLGHRLSFIQGTELTYLPS